MFRVWTVLLKDIRQEWRSRAAMNAILLFAVVSLSAVSFSVGAFSLNEDTMAALLWIVILFSSLSGFAHVFLKEEEAHTADTLKLLASPNEIFMGKFLFNFLLLLVLVTIIVPLFVALFNVPVKSVELFIALVVLGAFGLSVGGTIVAAIIAKTSSRGALFSVLAFPILLPVVVFGISGTRIAFKIEDAVLFGDEIKVLIAYGVILTTASIMLFEYIWND